MSQQLYPHVHVRAYLKPVEVLKRLRVNARTLYRLMSNGTLPAVRIGRQWRVCPSDFDLWLRLQANDVRAVPMSGAALDTGLQHAGATVVACQPLSAQRLDRRSPELNTPERRTSSISLRCRQLPTIAVHVSENGF